MKTIYFVRHGEADNNVGRLTSANIRYLGGESELTEKGKEQARFMATRAAHLPVTAIISSTYTRAKQTAEIIAEKTKHSIEYSDLLVERKNPTSLLGKQWRSPEVQEVQHAWEHSFFTDGRVEDGETFSEIVARAREARTLLEKRPESDLLVVTHGFFLRMLVAEAIFGDRLTPQLYRDLDEGMRTKNTGLTVMKYDPEDVRRPWYLLVWNDHAHLG